MLRTSFINAGAFAKLFEKNLLLRSPLLCSSVLIIVTDCVVHLHQQWYTPALNSVEDFRSQRNLVSSNSPDRRLPTHSKPRSQPQSQSLLVNAGLLPKITVSA